jgi:hypothetical protein
MAARGCDGDLPEREHSLAQALLICSRFALLKTFWPARSVALPTMPSNGDAMNSVLERLDAIEATGRGDCDS